MRRLFISLLLIPVLWLGACSEVGGRHAKAVYMLLDVSGTYSQELDKANAILNYLLGTLVSGDSLAVARIDSGSFTEKDIVAKVTFDNRPSVANQQKREMRDKLDAFIKNLDPSSKTDVSGGLLQASQYLNETGAGQKYIFVFSDLEQDLPQGYKRDFRIPLDGTEVVALNVTKLRSDNVDPQEYLDRLDHWQKVVQNNGGKWRVMNDLNRLDRLLQ